MEVEKQKHICEMKKWIVRKMLITFTSMAETQANKKKSNEKRGGLRVQKTIIGNNF